MATNKNNKAKPEENNRDRKISIRITEQEYNDITLTLTNGEGKKIMSYSDYYRHAANSSKVVIVDKEIDRYKIHAIHKCGNVITQLNKVLYGAKKRGTLSSNTFENIISELEKLNDEMTYLVNPLKY